MTQRFVVGFARALEAVLAQLRRDPQPLILKAKNASDFVLSQYRPEREEQDILLAWREILQKLPGG